MWRDGLLELHLLESVVPSPTSLAIVRRIIMNHLTSLPPVPHCVGCHDTARWDHFNTTFQLGRWEDGATSQVLTAAQDCLLAFCHQLCEMHGQMIFPKFASLDIGLLSAQSFLSSRFPAQLVACHLHSAIPKQSTVVSALKKNMKTEAKQLAALKAEVRALSNRLGLVESRTKHVDVMRSSLSDDKATASLQSTAKQTPPPSPTGLSSGAMSVPSPTISAPSPPSVRAVLSPIPRLPRTVSATLEELKKGAEGGSS
eukprot:GEMP01021420.1.p1 GENE.GEMP01021420.1~~GEMP01021420.1.p1  ORF type:complete len:256 (+),score=63.47 GEMP01021420.1:1215-1982(+)